MSASRVRTAALVIALIALCFLQDPGLISADTKLDLVVDPGRLMAQGLLAWTPEGQFGQVQNQAYGYLWPMGPFFWVGHALGVPAWVVQRLWWAMGLVVGFLGMRLLLRRLGIGGRAGALVGALAFVLAPRVIGLLGTTSVEAWPTMVLPWIMLPLVGRRSPVRAAALSAVAVLMLGGVNAAASFAVLVVPLLWLLLGAGVDRRAQRLIWWLLAVAAATSWWLLPLLSLSGAAFPFLNYIESAQVTGAVTSLLNVLRGAQHWVAYSGTAAGPTWTAGYELAVRPVLVLATTLVAALGVLGMAWRTPRIPQQRFLLVSLAGGLLVMSTGYAGAFGSPFADAVQQLLDAQLAPFRNIHKFDSLVRVPVSAGLAHLVAHRHGILPRAWAARPRQWVGAVGLAAVALAGSMAMAPFLSGGVASRGAYQSVPEHWNQASRWLDDNAPDGRVLVLPAANFGQFAWGSPLDEPLPTAIRSGWVLRNAVPLGAPGAIRWMDGVDSLVRSGRGSDDLAPALASAGVTHVLVRADLAAVPVRTPAAVVRAALVGSPGLRAVARFGARADAFFDDQVVTGADVPREIEIFEVTAEGSPALLVSDPSTIAAGPEASSTHGLAAAGVRAWVASADDQGSSVDVATDSPARRSQNFGAERGADLTPTLGAGDDALRGRPVSDISPFPESSPRVSSRLAGPVTRATASSSMADPFGSAYAGPGARPYLAVDADRATAWASDPSDPSPWLELTLATPAVTLEVELTGRSVARTVDAVVVEGGSSSVRVRPPPEGPVRLTLPRASARWRISIERRGAWPVGISWVGGLPGSTREIRDLPLGSSGGLVLQRMDAGRQACVDLGDDWACSRLWEVQAEETASIIRTVPGPLPAGSPTIWLRSVPGPELDEHLDAAAGLRVEASSAAFPDPSARAGAAFDGDDTTAWIPQAADLQPRVDVITEEPRSARRFRFVADGRYEGLTATLLADGRVVARGVRPGGVASFEPVSARSWRLVLATDSSTPLPVRIREVDLGWPAPRPVLVSCADGPGVRFGQTQVRYAVQASVARLMSGELVPARACPSIGDSDGVPAGQTDAGGLRAEGNEVVAAQDLPWLRVDRLSWLSEAPRSVGVVVEQPDAHTRRIQVPASDRPMVVALTEGYSQGWRADLEGVDLAPLRLEGWRQGWRIPARDTPGVLTAAFGPATSHRSGLALGLALALVVLGAGGWAWRSAPSSGGPGGSATDPGGTGSPLAFRSVVALTVVLGGALAGWAGLAITVLAIPVWRLVTPRAPWLAAACVGGAGLVAATGDGPLAGGSQLALVAGLALLAGAATHPLEDGLLDGPERQPGQES